MESINLESQLATTRRLVKDRPSVKKAENSLIDRFLFLPPNEKRSGEGGLRTQGYFKHNSSSTTTLDKDSFTSPLITIITVVFNNEKHLESTIKSVIDRAYDNLEYIIIDGGSTDGTLDIVRKYERAIDYWVSEPDKGIYDAMNKGISLANGDIIGFLNSGDIYTDWALTSVAELYDRKTAAKESLIITGAMWRFDRQKELKFKLTKTSKDLESKINWSMPINHPTTFVARQVYETIGDFNPNFRISGDYDFVFRAYHSQAVKFIFTDTVLAHMDIDGVSERLSTLWRTSIEHFLVRQKQVSLIPNVALSVKWLSVLTFKRFFRNILPRNIMTAYYNLRHK